MDADTLAAYPWVVVRLACERCRRRGSYRLARLAERYGADCRLMDLLLALSADCTFRSGKRFAGSYEECGAYFLDLQHNPEPPDLPPAIYRLRLVRGGKT